MWFEGGGRRDYLIHHRQAGKNGRPARVSARSFAAPGRKGFDLRVPADAARMAAILQDMPLDDPR